jgi:hypothetical protein
MQTYRPAHARPTTTSKAAPSQKENLVPATNLPTSKTSVSSKESAKSSSDAFNKESAMDALYARLNSKTVLTPRTPVGSTVGRPDETEFSFGARLAEAKADKIKADKAEARGVEVEQAENSKVENQKTTGSKIAEMTQAELENEYMRKATEYIHALPDSKGNTANLIKAMSKMLRSSYVPQIKVDVEKNEAIKTRLAFAVANYINKILKKRLEPRTTESIKQTLKDADGDFLQLCAKLVDEGYVSLETLAEVSGIVTTMRDVLPKSEPVAPAAVKTPPTVAPAIASSADNSKSVSKDPVINMKGWPTQDKRENRKSTST